MGTDKWPKRIITKSDRLIVCRNPVAKDYNELDAIETLTYLRNMFYKFQKHHHKYPDHVIGIRMYRKLEKLFGRYDDIVIIDETDIDFSTLTDYNISNCDDWWDLCDTEKIEK